jgi:hypothetical protein
MLDAAAADERLLTLPEREPARRAYGTPTGYYADDNELQADINRIALAADRVPRSTCNEPDGGGAIVVDRVLRVDLSLGSAETGAGAAAQRVRSRVRVHNRNEVVATSIPFEVALRARDYRGITDSLQSAQDSDVFMLSAPDKPPIAWLRAMGGPKGTRGEWRPIDLTDPPFGDPLATAATADGDRFRAVVSRVNTLERATLLTSPGGRPTGTGSRISP